MDSYRCISGVGLEHLYGLERAARRGAPPGEEVEGIALSELDAHVRSHKPCGIIYICIAKRFNLDSEVERIKSGVPYGTLRAAKE